MGYYIREQKHICGASYDTAPYMEVDLYHISAKQHKASVRAKRKEATSLAMQKYNDRKAIRYHVQLANANFDDNDYSLTLTYDDDHLPDPDDTEKADRDWDNYVKRLYRFCDRKGIERPVWMMATEYATREGDKVVGRHHHHAMIKHTEGLTRDDLERLWAEKRKPLGLSRCERLRFDHGSIESLVNYINKNERCKRHWRQSRGLKMPVRPRPNDSKWTRKKLEDASTMYVDDREFWERMYPGYTLNRVEAKVNMAGNRHTVVILRRAEFRTAAETAGKPKRSKKCVSS